MIPLSNIFSSEIYQESHFCVFQAENILASDGDGSSNGLDFIRSGLVILGKIPRDIEVFP